MKYFISKSKINFIFIIIFVGLHLAYIQTPFINLEWVYRMGALYFLSGEPFYLEQYIQYQANPLTYSYIVSYLMKWTDLDQFYIYRIPSIGGGLLLLICIAYYQKPWLLIFIGLNPLVWIYSGRAYSDILAVGIMMLAYKYHNLPIRSGIILAISGMIKYHTMPVMLLFTGFNWLFENWKKRFTSWYNNSLIFCIITLFVWINFIIFYENIFGIWIVPEKFIQTHGSFNFNNLINNLFSYTFYLSSMFIVTLPFFLNREKIKHKLIYLLFSVTLAISNQNLGEMDFGSLNQLLNNEIIIIIKILGFWNFLMCFSFFWMNKNSRILLLTIVLYLFLLSFSKPSQRYLIFVIPFWVILIFQNMSLSKIICFGYVSILLFLNTYTTLYQISNAQASQNLANWAVKNDVMIDLGKVVFAHVGEFSHHDLESNLKVSLSSVKNRKVMHEEKVSVFGYQIRSYVIIDTNKKIIK